MPYGERTTRPNPWKRSSSRASARSRRLLQPETTHRERARSSARSSFPFLFSFPRGPPELFEANVQFTAKAKKKKQFQFQCQCWWLRHHLKGDTAEIRFVLCCVWWGRVRLWVLGVLDMVLGASRSFNFAIFLFFLLFCSYRYNPQAPTPVYTP